jgi:hypothetical protein
MDYSPSVALALGPSKPDFRAPAFGLILSEQSPGATGEEAAYADVSAGQLDTACAAAAGLEGSR